MPRIFDNIEQELLPVLPKTIGLADGRTSAWVLRRVTETAGCAMAWWTDGDAVGLMPSWVR